MQHIYLIPAFLASVGDHWATLVSGVLTFLLGLWFAHRGKTAGFGALAVFAVVCVIFSVYMAWEDEYRKNIGNAFFTFSDLQPKEAPNQSIDVSLTVMNETQKTVNIEEIRVVRMWVNDVRPFVGGPAVQWCQMVNVSPQVSRIPPYQAILFNHPADPNVHFEYLENTKIRIDGTEKQSAAIIIDSGKGHIFDLTAKGKYEAANKETNGIFALPGHRIFRHD